MEQNLVGNGIKSLNELIPASTRSAGDKTFLSYQNNDYTYTDLRRNSEQYAGYFIDAGIKKGDKVALILDNCPEYFFAFFGILLAGASVVSISPKSKVDRVVRIVEHSDSVAIVSDDSYKDLNVLRNRLDSIHVPISTLSRLNQPRKGNWDYKYESQEEEIAFYQYTSGTTGFSKGTMISHKSAIANIRGIAERLHVKPFEDVASSLMPLYHDMGLIGFGLFPIYSGCKLVLYRQDIRNIYQWLEDFKKHRVTISGASNTLLYLTRRVVDDPRQYDLSSLKVMLVGSEPIFLDTVRNFEKDYGLANIIVPAYGLAEVTLCATMHSPGKPFLYDRSKTVSCGTPLNDVEIRIHKDKNSDLGEVWIKSPAVMSGYHKEKELSDMAFENGYFKTGDLGYLDENNELYIYGRIKDIIIRDGENLFPQELEEIALTCDGIRNACVVGIPDFERNNREEIILVAEISKFIFSDQDDLMRVYRILREKIKIDSHYQPEKIYFVPPVTIPFSPNGKLQRLKMKEMIQSGELNHANSIVM
jgi:acyl-CoA synthetase (AMP-forming)/AMP-acid ligase II